MRHRTRGADQYLVVKRRGVDSCITFFGDFTGAGYQTMDVFCGEGQAALASAIFNLLVELLQRHSQ